MASTWPTLPLTIVRTLDLAQSLPSGRAYVSAASGLARVGDEYLVAIDDDQHVGLFPCEGAGRGRALRIVEGALPTDPAARKRRKPDFEAVVVLPPMPGITAGAVLVIGSGSTERRERAVVLALDPAGRLSGDRQQRSLGPLYEPIRAEVAELNVEAAIVSAGALVLVSRANRGQPVNTVARFPLDQVGRWLAGSDRALSPSIGSLRLGEIAGVPLGVTDATAHPNGGWLVSAVAEDTPDSYADGVVLGAVLVHLNEAGDVVGRWSLEPKLKVEGLETGVMNGDPVVVVVSDADDPAVPATLAVAPLPG